MTSLSRHEMAKRIHRTRIEADMTPFALARRAGVQAREVSCAELGDGPTAIMERIMQVVHEIEAEASSTTA